eukprot:SAG31_NODE_153_length_22196_cov_24.963570_21_plen_157_part_00
MDEDQAGKDDDKPETAFSQKLLAVNSDAEPTVEQENKSMSVDTQPVDAQAETQADDDEPSATETAPASQGTGSPTWIESWVCEAEKVPGLSTMMPNGVRTNLKVISTAITNAYHHGAFRICDVVLDLSILRPDRGRVFNRRGRGRTGELSDGSGWS